MCGCDFASRSFWINREDGGGKGGGNACFETFNFPFLRKYFVQWWQTYMGLCSVNDDIGKMLMLLFHDNSLGGTLANKYSWWISWINVNIVVGNADSIFTFNISE